MEQINYHDKFDQKVEEYHFSNKIQGEIKNIELKDYNRLFRIKDKSDRATTELVLDARTIRVLQKLMNKGELLEVNGCISTGKEANVYHGKGPNNTDLAIKIYKTSILIFKDRGRYIEGEFRFRHGYCKANPRKMVALWAEKEVRNLKRLKLADINCPTPTFLKNNVIVMNFIGNEEKAAPRLKDAHVETAEEWENIYIEIIRLMRVMFKQCKLVHSDFSEYNILYHEGQIYIIDVAQAVEDFHPNALYFLRRDCHNINTFFEKKGVDTILDQNLFDIVSSFELSESIGDIVKKNRENIRTKIEENSKFVEVENGMFLNFEIPRSLKEEDVDKITNDVDIEEALTKLCGIVRKKEENVAFIEKNNNNDDDDDEEDEEDEESEDDDIENELNKVDAEEEEDNENKKKSQFDPFVGLSKKERKTKVKEEKREKRANKKLTKYEKQKIVKRTSGKR